MKNILVSIDFSICTRQVAQCLAKLAEESGARLILFHAYRAEEPLESKQPIGIKSERLVQARLDKLAQTLYVETGVSITRIMMPVSDSSRTQEVAKLVKADVAVICEQTQQSHSTFTFTQHQDLPVFTVSTSSAPDLKALEKQLSAQLKSIEYSAKLN